MQEAKGSPHPSFESVRRGESLDREGEKNKKEKAWDQEEVGIQEESFKKLGSGGREESLDQEEVGIQEER